MALRGAYDVARLVRGSAEIDRMEKEIPAVVSMIRLSVMRSQPDYAKRTEDEVRTWYGAHELPGSFKASNACVWLVKLVEVEVAKKRPPEVQLVIECFFNGRTPRLAFSSAAERIFFSLEDVQPIHESLSVLLEGVVKIFPEAEKEMDVFFRAAGD